MPADALPVPWPRPIPGTVHLHREYRDLLGRPMRGTVAIAGSERLEVGDLVVPPAPVTAAVENGMLDVDLPPDTYTLTATLRTVDGERVSDRETVAHG